MRDDNKVPAMYVLQRISKNIPTFASEIREERWQAGDAWWAVQGDLYGIFNRAAERIGTTWDQLCAPSPSLTLLTPSCSPPGPILNPSCPCAFS
eukprot:1188306-Prorocentrum_minimum.AAC.1